MLDFTKLWDKSYLFGPNPVELSRSDHGFFWIALIFVVASITAKLFTLREKGNSPKKHLMNRFYHLFLTTGLLVLLWIGARFENIPWLSTHIVALFLLLVWAVWLFFIGRYFLKEYRSQQQNWESEQVKRKYL